MIFTKKAWNITISGNNELPLKVPKWRHGHSQAATVMVFSRRVTKMRPSMGATSDFGDFPPLIPVSDIQHGIKHDKTGKPKQLNKT